MTATPFVCCVVWSPLDYFMIHIHFIWHHHRHPHLAVSTPTVQPLTFKTISHNFILDGEDNTIWVLNIMRILTSRQHHIFHSLLLYSTPEDIISIPTIWNSDWHQHITFISPTIHPLFFDTFPQLDPIISITSFDIIHTPSLCSPPLCLLLRQICSFPLDSKYKPQPRLSRMSCHNPLSYFIRIKNLNNNKCFFI